MSFGEAISTCLIKKYATFTGRARRSEYWYFSLFAGIIVGGLVVLNFATGNSLISVLLLVVELVLALPSAAVTVRRLHDSGKTGWYIFIGLIPFIGPIALLIFLIDDTDKDGDKYGPSPKAVAYSS